MLNFIRKRSSGKAPELTEEERLRRNKILVYLLMFLLFAGAIWLIFAPSGKERETGMQGFNTDMPAPQEAGIIGDKKKAYEKDLMERKEQERIRAMQDMGEMFDGMTGNTSSPAGDNVSLDSEDSRYGYGGSSQGSHAGAASRQLHASASAYRDINRTLDNFYEIPREDPEKEELRVRLMEMERKMDRQQTAMPTMNDQMALLEKSYQLAAKYMPSEKRPGVSPDRIPEGGTASGGKAVPTSHNGKAAVFPVRQKSGQVVSALAQPMSDTTFRSEYVKERLYAFNTAVGVSSSAEKNTISACVHDNQKVMDGQTVRFRLLEPIQVSNREIPRNALVVGVAKVQGERLNVLITSLEYRGNILPVELSVYDTDGQAGIFIPGSMERSAAKEIAANMGTSVGSSVNISTNAGAQLASDLGKGLIQGTSQYFAKKMRTVKVHLKAGYRVLLYQPENK